MMTHQNAADAIIAIFIVFGICWVFYGPWQRVCGDVARQMLYERRDKIFDLAIANDLSFNSEEYRHIRRTLDSAIAFSSELTWPKILLYKLMHHNNDSVILVQHSIDKIPDEDVRNKVTVLVDESMLLLLMMTIMKSIIISPLSITICIAAIFTKGLNEVTRIIAEQRNAMLVEISHTIEVSSELAQQDVFDEQLAA